MFIAWPGARAARTNANLSTHSDVHTLVYIYTYAFTDVHHTYARSLLYTQHTYTHCYIRSIHYIHPLLYTQHTLHTPIAIHAAYIHPLLYTQHTYTHCYTHTIHYIHPLLYTHHTLHTLIAMHTPYITYTHCYTHTIHYIHPLLHTQHTFICRLLCSTRLPQSYAMGCALSWLCRAVAKQASQRISYDVYID